MFEVYVPFYNSTFCAEYQAKTLKAFMKDDDVQIIFIDNNMGRYPETSAHLEKVCQQHDIALIVNTDPTISELQKAIEDPEQMHIGVSDKLGWTLNLIYHTAKSRGAEYFGFLDQDCFAFKPVRLKEYLDDRGAYGKVVPTHPCEEQHMLADGEWVWNLHVTTNFYKTQFLLDAEAQGHQINFLPGSWAPHFDLQRVILDTGGMNWHSVWKHEENPAKYVLPEKHYFYYDDLSLLDPKGEHPTRVLYEMIDDRWIHMVHGAISAASSDYMQPKTSYIKGFLDLALMNAGAVGAAPRSEFTGTYYETDRHRAFTPQYTLDPNHDLDEVLKEHVPGKILIETGTAYGRTVKQALSHGAREVHSVEAQQEYFDACKTMFRHDTRVKQWYGKSCEMLPAMLQDIHEPAVIFLDAHPAGVAHLGPTFGHKEVTEGDVSFSQHQILTRELHIIAQHSIKSHTIILDDQQLQGDEAFQEEYKEILRSINPEYQISLVQKQHIVPPVGCLIAEIKK